MLWDRETSQCGIKLALGRVHAHCLGGGRGPLWGLSEGMEVNKTQTGLVPDFRGARSDGLLTVCWAGPGRRRGLPRGIHLKFAFLLGK